MLSLFFLARRKALALALDLVLRDLLSLRLAVCRAERTFLQLLSLLCS